MRRISRRLNSGLSLGGESRLEIAVDIFLPNTIPQNPVLLVCHVGGGLQRGYFDLRPPGGDPSFSFAEQMSARTYLLMTLDYPGIGQSDRPADGFELTPDRLADVCIRAAQEIGSAIKKGRFDKDLAPMPALRLVGIGHSMGAMLTVIAQAKSKLFESIALLGFSTRGLPEYVSAHAAGMAGNPDRVRTELVSLARAQFSEPYPVINPGSRSARIYGGLSPEADGLAAIRQLTAPILPVGAMLAMMPGNVAQEARQIDVPVLLILGEQDIAGPPAEVPKAFSSSPSVQLEVLPGAGHSHFIFASRIRLFDVMAQWLGQGRIPATPKR